MTLYAKYMILDDSAHGTWHMALHGFVYGDLKKAAAKEER